MSLKHWCLRQEACLSQGYARELGQGGEGYENLTIHQDHSLNELI